jgi:hypothetical protein
MEDEGEMVEMAETRAQEETEATQTISSYVTKKPKIKIFRSFF